MGWTDVVKAALSLLAATLTAVTPFLVTFLSRHVKKDDLTKLDQYANQAVRAAEQIGKVRQLDRNEKFDYAETFLTQLAGKAGISLSKNDVQPLVEAAVSLMNQWKPAEFIASSIGTVESAIPVVPAGVTREVDPEAIARVVLQKVVESLTGISSKDVSTTA